MRPRTATRASWALWIFTMALLAGTLALVVLNRSLGNGGFLYAYVALSVATIAYATAGALIIARVRGNPIGWALVGMGLALLLSGFGEQYLLRALVTAPGSLPGTSFVTWFAGGWTISAAVAPIPIVFLLFPTGRILSPGWRWILRIALAVLVLGVVGQMLFPGHVDGLTNSLSDQGPHLINPTGLQGARSFLGAALAAAGLMGVGAAVVSIGSLVWRFHRADLEERIQIKWLAFVAISTLLLLAIAILDPLFVGQNSVANDVIFIAMVSFVFLGIPAAVAIAILKYRLYDIDLVIRKAIVVGAMAAFITAVYAGIVAAGSRIFTSTTSSFFAAAVLAIGFQPARERARHLADRIVYGRRATPYEVLAELGERFAGEYATDEVLDRLATVVAEGVAAERVVVWLRVGNELRPATVRPVGSAPPTVAFDGTVAGMVDGTRAFEVRHQGEVLGALGVTKPASDPLTVADEKLVGDLAAQAGLVLRNVVLIEDLRASRRRLVSAQDEERRRLERNIHDGAQQQLVALAVKARLARQLTSGDPAKAGAMLEQIERETQQALEDLRDLARGIYPPLLADKGLGAALEAQARKASVPVEVRTNGIGRYPQEIEAAVYFCCLEALNNVSKYAGAGHVWLDLREVPEGVMFEVVDDGTGFDPTTKGYGTGLQGMADRLEAIGGSLEVRSAPGRGTTITGRVHAQASEAG